MFRTMDGGATWEKVLYVSPKVGVIDLVMNPKNPAVLYAATYEKAAAAVADGQRRAGQRDLQDDGRGQDVDEAGRRVAERTHRPHRSRHLLEQSGDPLRGDRERQPARGRRRRRTRRRAVRGRADHRRRGVPHVKRRSGVDEDERGRLRRQSERALLLQPDSRRSEQRPEHLRDPGRLPAFARRRQDVGRTARVSADVRRRAHAVDRSGEFGPHDSGQRRRRGDLVRRRAHERSLRQPAGRRGLRDQRRQRRAVQPLRGVAGSRELARAVEHGPGTRHPERLVRGRRRRRHVDGRRSGGQPMALHQSRVRIAQPARSRRAAIA